MEAVALTLIEERPRAGFRASQDKRVVPGRGRGGMTPNPCRSARRGRSYRDGAGVKIGSEEV